MRTRSFGVSSRLFRGHRLGRDHVREIGAHGFEHLELSAEQTHFDYHSPTAIGDLQGWLADARVTLHAVHAPLGERGTSGSPLDALNLASPDPGARQRALEEVEAALHIARRIPFQVFVVHTGVPKTPQSVAGENSRDGARRSLEVLQRQAEPLGVTVALEVIPNDLARPPALVHFIEKVAEGGRLGICLDLGHAHLGGDVVDAVETVAEHLISVHLHDNRGRSDEHLIPFDGSIDWPAVLTAVQKVGYDGALTFEVAGHGATKATLQKLRDVRGRLDRLLTT